MGWVLHATPEVDAQSQYPTIIAVCVVLSAFSVGVVSARLCVRSKARGLASDDYMAALSMVFALFYAAVAIAQTRYGLGLPLALRPKEDLVLYTRVNFAGRPIYQLGVSFFKIALLVSYLRLLNGTDSRTYRTIIWVSIWLIFLSHLACAFALVFACTPVNFSWDPTIKGHCLAPGPTFTAYAAVTIVSDVIVGLIPLPVLLRLEVRTSKKFGLIGIFTLGIFTTVCSIMRYLQIRRIQSGDGNSTMLVLWGTVEFNVGNIVSSLPFLAPLFLRKAREYRSKRSQDYATPNGGSRNRGALGSRFSMKLLTPGGRSDAGGSAIGSRENILGTGRNILKSVTYSVKVDDASTSASYTSTPGPSRDG